MKIRHSVLLFCAIAVAVVVLLVWFRKQAARTASVEGVNTSTPIAEQSESITTQGPNVQQGIAPRINSPASALQIKSDDPQRGLAGLNDVPIIFDGKVEDQFGNPVAGATIDASVRIYNGSKSGVDRFTVTADANGLFHIDHGKGEALGVVPRKEGYVLATANTYFKYSYMYEDRFQPNPKNPTVVKMWKLQGAEPLLRIDQRHGLPYTAEPINFDLLTGKITPTGGDIRITIMRSDGVVSERTLRDWGVKVEAVDGGLIKGEAMDARVTFAAPEKGYVPSDTFIMSTNPPYKWSGGIDQMYFIKTRGGRLYGKVNLNIGINQNPEDKLSFEFRGRANTNGSRNFEADAPAQKAAAAR